MNEIEPDKTEPEPQPEAERDDKGKFKKKEPATPEEPEVKTEPEPKTEPEVPKITNEEYKKQIEELTKELVELRKFKNVRTQLMVDNELQLKAIQTKEDQKLKGFKEEKKSEGDQVVTTPLYRKMSFKNLTETSKKMRKK